MPHRRRTGCVLSVNAVAFYILVCAILTLVATSMMTDYTGKDIEGEYE